MDETNALMAAGGLAAPFQRMEEPEVLALLGTRYGARTSSLTRFDTEKDDTFLIREPDGRAWVLKIANPLEDEREIDLQLALLQHVEATDPGLPAPRVMRTQNGEGAFTIVDGAGQVRIVRALSYLDGTPLDRIDATAAERRSLGAVLARLRLAMAGFSHPHDGREIAWDVKHLPKLRGLLAHMDDRAQRNALELGLARMESLAPALARCRTQVVHNDCSRSNIVVDRARPGFVTGIIDFGDVVRTAIVIDVSTTLLNQLPSQARPDLFAEGRDILQGYLAVADLTPEELALLPHLVMARVIARALITTWRAERFPDNAQYIMRNTHQGWQQLDWFLSRSIEDVSATFSAVPAGA
ncbi:homoserine kinase [Azorhizobium oxalatiphilum]|uniref:Hydroxylysine kinase n=1 Tax=Azorhizobium oxalatiphilum TaxID=980631 RepID=A0A917C3T5_9HYPH|nr:phosphotransferase [Azorhizobium oxalatiphilum]GGF68670.1 homoserine kinase [Azorhizobium oxalatiphilum]